MKKNATIEHMIRFIKKWWLLRRLYKECCKHAFKESDDFFYKNNKYYVERPAFLKLFCEKKRYTSKQRKAKINEYNSIINSCKKEGYIHEAKREDEIGVIIANRDVPFITTTSTGEDIIGYADLIQQLVGRYNFLWGVIGAVIGYFAKGVIDYLISLFKLSPL